MCDRADRSIAGELDASPLMRTAISSLAKRLGLRIKELDRQVLAAARADATVRRSVPGVGPMTALSVASAFD
jgi:transposase